MILKRLFQDKGAVIAMTIICVCGIRFTSAYRHIL